MRRVATVAEVWTADAAASAVTGEAVLIERAATAVAVRAGSMLAGTYGARVVVLAGRGHNGADALLAGERLARRGAQVSVVRSSDAEPDALGREALARVERAGGRLLDALPESADLVVDGMVGLGGDGALRGRAAEIAGQVAARGWTTLAVDLPSGVDADTGAVGGVAVSADVTVTFDVLKPGLLLGAGAEHAGLVEVVDVGLGLAGTSGQLGAVDASDVAGWLPHAGRDSDKRSRGAVGVVAGSGRYPGAAVLCVGGAVVAGAGYVRYAGPVAGSVLSRWPSVVPGEGHVDAVVVGPGLGSDPDVIDRVDQVLAAGLPTVVDADGLGVGADRLRGRASVITPHARELERVTGSAPGDDPLGAARAAARDLGCVVLLKGATTVVASPDGSALLVLTGTPWLSTAGTGDVLAGAIGALLAAGAAPAHAAAAAAFLHGLAGREASRGGPISADLLLESWHLADRSVRSGPGATT